MRRLTTKPLVKFSTEHPWMIILFSFLITLAMFIPMKNLKIEPDVKSLLPESIIKSMADNSPEQSVDYDNLAIMFSGKYLFTPEGLQLFDKTVKDIGEALSAEKLVTPFAQTILEKTGGRLKIVPLSPNGRAPETSEEAEIFIKRLKESPFSKGLLTSKNHDVLAAYFFIHKGRDYIEMMKTLRAITDPLQDRVKVTITGTMPFSAEIERFLTKDFFKLLVLVFVTILFSYYLGFRSRRALFIPMLLVISGTVFAMGWMGIMGFKLTMVSIISPPLILTMGSSYSIHVLNAYYTTLRENPGINKQEAILESVTGISGTVVLASLTTIVALLSLLLATIQKTREFAISTSIGIFFTALLSITLLPAFLSLQKIPKQKKLDTISTDLLSRILTSAGQRLINGKRTAIVIMTVIIVSFLYIYPKISFNTSPFLYFPEKSAVIQDNSRFMSKIGGIEEMTIAFKPKNDGEGFFLRPDILSNIHEIENKIMALGNVSFIFSFPSYLEYAGKTYNGKPYDFKSKGLNILVSRMFHTTAGDSADKYVNKDFTSIHTTIKIHNKSKNRPVDEHDMIVLKENLIRILTENLNDETDWKLNGLTLAFLDLSYQMRRDFVVSTLGALAAISLLAYIAFRSIRQSLLALIPLLTGIFTSLILMALTNIPLDMTTIMVACISIGVGVDDSIHFLLSHHLNKALYPGDPAKAVYETLIHAGRPIVLTTVSIVSGLLFLALANFRPIRYFGLLIVFTLATACLATLFLLPPLLNTGEKK